jgi:Uma2 family endonuclease
MAEVGVLAPDAQVELFAGQVFDCFRISPLHAAATSRLAESFFGAPEESYIVSVRNPVRLDDYNELQPDLALLKFISNYYKTRHPGPEDVFLLIEVADASLDYDREEKLPTYGRAGVPEVWIVNLVDLTVEVYREPHFTGYGSKTILRAGDKACPAVFPDVTVDVAELLRR